MGNVLMHAFAIAAKDIRAELRSRTSLVTALGFAALVLVIFNFARDPTRLQASLLAPSALWITSTFAAMTTLTRAFAVETESGALDALRLAPISREAIYLGKFLGNLAFAFTVEAVTLPLFLLFFNVDIGEALLGVIAVLLVATIGFTAVGTLFGALVARLRNAELLLPLLVLPFLIPPLVGGVQVTSHLLDGQSLAATAGWLRLLLVYDVIFLVVGTLVFPSVFDE